MESGIEHPGEAAQPLHHVGVLLRHHDGGSGHDVEGEYGEGNEDEDRERSW